MLSFVSKSGYHHQYDEGGLSTNFFSILLKTSKKYDGEEKLAQAAFPLATRPYIAHQKNISGGHALSLDCCINLSLFDESPFSCFKVGKV